MNALRYNYSITLLTLLVAGYAGPAAAQVPVDDSGAPLATYEPMDEGAPEGNEQIPLLTRTELQDLVGPVALYPDDLLAIVLPASTYPLEIVQAARFLDELEADGSLEPDESWDESVVALLNYPEVVRMMDKEIDWTWRLGEAVISQQADLRMQAFPEENFSSSIKMAPAGLVCCCAESVACSAVAMRAPSRDMIASLALRRHSA